MGHQVIATMRDVANGEQLLDECRAESLDLKVRQLDVCDPDSVAAALADADHIDALVNNAGFEVQGALETIDDELIQRQLDTNVMGPLRTIRSVLPAWRARGSGAVVNVSSVVGIAAMPWGGAYAASKWALEGMSESLHFETANAGIRVHLAAADACWARVLEIDRRTGRAPDPIALFGRAAQLAYAADDMDEVIRLTRDALEGATSAGDEIAAATARINLALFRWMGGDRSAAGLAEESLRIARAIGGPTAVAHALYAVGYTLQLDDPGRAIECFREGIEQFRRIAFAAMVELCFIMLIRLQALQGDLGAALESFRSGLERSYEQGSRVNGIYNLKQGALALTRAGHADAAAVLLGYVDAQPQRGTAGWEGEFHEGLIAEARVALGTAEYDAAAARGAAMPYDEIVQYALTELDRVQAEPTDS